MSTRKLRHVWRGLITAAPSCGLLSAHMTVTGTITGTGADPSGQITAGAKVTFTSTSTSDLRSAVAGEGGAFNLTAVQPDAYNLRVEQPGFKAAERRGVINSANERVNIGEIVLQVGEATETIRVNPEAAQVQVDSSEHSAQLTTNQLVNLTARGREVVSMLRSIPGVQYQADQNSTGGRYGTGTPNIAGSFSGTNVLAVDGVISNDQETPNVFSSVTTLDAIGEVKVLLNSYQAEYAGNGGPIVQVVTRSGTSEFHGNGYECIRNDARNANDFFNNRNGVKRPRYRYNTFGGTLGGPLYIPGHWNQSRTKLFAFHNIEEGLISTGRAEFVHHADASRTPGRFFPDAGRERQADSDHGRHYRHRVPRQRDPQHAPEPQRTGADEHPAAALLLQSRDLGRLFGQVSSTRAPRIMQGSLLFTFCQARSRSWRSVG